MKVCLYTENYEQIAKSGLGRAIKHQMKALEIAGVEYTTDLGDDYDVLHINTYAIMSYAMAHIKSNKAAIVYHAHSTEEDFRNSFKFSNQIAPIFKWWIKQCYSLGDVIVTPSEYSKKILESYELEPPIHVVSNGINIEEFKATEDGAKNFREKYNLSDDEKVVIGVGLYIKRKGILDFIELAKRMPEVKFIWFGHTDPILITSEVNQALKTELPNLIFAGYVESSILREAYQGANLFLFPTYEETEGIVMLESMAMKLPVLIRDIPIYEDFEDRKLLYKAKTIEEFQERIEEILHSDNSVVIENAYQHIQSKDISKIGEQLKQVYQEALKIKAQR